MNGGADSEFDGLPLEAVLRVNALCDAFEAACRAGQQPRISDFLGDAVDRERDILLTHLAALEAEYAGISFEEFASRLAAELQLPAGSDSPVRLSATALAESLIAEGTLTEYQARMLLAPHPHPLVLDDYVILDRLGAGGMGTVFRALHRRMKRQVALKLVADGRGGDAERGRWFRREIEAAARLVHPNVVTAYDAGEARGLAYLVSELVEGIDLRREVIANGRMTVADALRALRDAAAGLAHAHSCGVIHRDVKPSNLIRDRSGVVRVLDVGLARLAGAEASGEARSTVAGTPGFMAPEQAENPDAADPRADVFALGRTLYFLLNGLPPSDTALSLRDVRPDVPPRLDALHRRMTAPQPIDRPQSMNDVIAELDQIIAPRSRRKWAVAAVVLASVFAGTAFAVWRPMPSPRPEPEPQKLTNLPPRSLPPIREVPFDAAEYQAEWAAALGWPVEIEPLPGLKARLVPPGRFAMGSPVEEIERLQSVETDPEIRARLASDAARPAAVERPFYLGTTEVPVGLFRRFADDPASPYRTTAERPDGIGYRLGPNGAWTVEPGGTWRAAGAQPITEDHPACNLTRDDCADFCRWLTIRLTGRYECRLPTETEWEYACRAGSAATWTCGADPSGLGTIAWYAGTVDIADARIRPVGRKSPNRFGFFDMHGNLEEWCHDTEGRTVMRGGHVRSAATGVRSAARAPAQPNEPRGGCRVVLVTVAK